MDDRPDLHFHWDPVCPFAWMTSKWLRMVAEQRALEVDWRFISLRQLNAHVDYDSHFPAGYLEGHTAGLRQLRVAAAVRAAEGPRAMGPLYEAYGGAIFQTDPPADGLAFRRDLGTAGFAEATLSAAGLPTRFAEHVDDESLDAVVQADTDAALAATGRDVGTPIIVIDPPDGPGFFGPVISRLPSLDDAVDLWDSVTHLVRFGGFAELKRSLRELPQLPALGVPEDAVGEVEDWHGGSRRLKK